jgi:hypothetical protein
MMAATRGQPLRAGELGMPPARLGAVLVASLLWLVVGGFAYLELRPMVPQSALGSLLFIAFVPPAFMLVYLAKGEDWSQLGEMISTHPKRWVRIALGALVSVIILVAALVLLWLR